MDFQPRTTTVLYADSPNGERLYAIQAEDLNKVTGEPKPLRTRWRLSEVRQTNRFIGSFDEYKTAVEQADMYEADRAAGKPL